MLEHDLLYIIYCALPNNNFIVFFPITFTFFLLSWSQYNHLFLLIMSVGQNKKKKQKKPAQSSWLPRKEIKMGMFLYCIKMRLKKMPEQILIRNVTILM